MKRVAAWVIASAASLAGHLVLLAFVSSLAGGTASPPLAELRISEDSGFAVTAVPEVQSQTVLKAKPRDTQATQPVSAPAKSALAPVSSANANTESWLKNPGSSRLPQNRLPSLRKPSNLVRQASRMQSLPLHPMRR